MINCDYESGSCRLSKYCVLIMVFVWFVFIVVLIWKLRNPKNYPRTSYTPSIIQLYWPRPGITLYTTTLILIVTDIAGLAASLQPTFCKWLLQYWSNVATKIDTYGNMVYVCVHNGTKLTYNISFIKFKRGHPWGHRAINILAQFSVNTGTCTLLHKSGTLRTMTTRSAMEIYTMCYPGAKPIYLLNVSLSHLHLLLVVGVVNSS